MNRTLVFAGLGALGMALLVAMLISAGSNNDKAPAAEILVATKDIPIGSKLDAANARWQKWPNAESIPGALVRSGTKDDEWQGQKVRRALAKDEPITSGALVREIKGSYLAAALDNGMRAIAIDVKAASGVAGFLAPGDRVDVILTYNARLNSSNNEPAIMTGENEGLIEKATETIVQNVRVMATDQDAAGNTSGEREAKISKNITLEVTPKDAEKIAMATQMGELYLVLRQLGDTTKIAPTERATTDFTTGTILQKAARNVGGNPGNRIRVYTAQGVQEVPVTGGTR